MVKSFKYLFQFTWVNLASLLGFAVIVTAGTFLSGVPGGAHNIFTTYFGSFPILALMVVFIFACNLCASNMNIALSFGAKRRDYFWVLQANLLVYTGVCWAIQALMSAIPMHFNWTGVESWSVLMSLGSGASWLYPLVLMSMLCLGCLCGLVFVRSKAFGMVLFAAGVVAIMAAMVLLLLSADKVSGVWGDLRLVLFLITLAVFAVSEVLIWRAIKHAVVR